MKINKILIPIDFSECSINALHYALQINESINAEIHILNAYSIPIPVADDSILVEEYQHKINKQFELLKTKLPLLKSTNHEITIFVGNTNSVIIDTAKKQHVDLIIMGTQGAGNKIGEWLGSVTYEVIVKSSCPVLAIPSQYKFKAPKKLLFATDYISIENVKGLDTLYWFSKYFDSETHFLNIGEEKDDFTSEQSAGAKELHEFFEDSPHAFHFVKNVDVEKGLDRFILSNQVDLLALMPRKHKVLEKLFNGSLTKKVAHHTKIPLLTFHEIL